MNREEAIQELKYAQAMWSFDPSTGEVRFRNDEDKRQYEAFGIAIEALKAQLLKENTTFGKWIPCSERLPEEREWIGTKKFGTTISDEVYVTFENLKGERFCKHLSFQNGKLSNYDQSEIDVWYKGSQPIAWMPLPEPYKEEQNED